MYFTTGVILLFTLGLTFLIGVPLMFMNVPITPFHIPLSFLLASIAAYFITTKRVFIKSLVASCCIIAVGLWIGGMTCDVTFDSYFYHFDIVEHLVLHHWNPYLGTNPPENSPIWTLHYPYYSEYVEACIYSLLKDINMATGYLYWLIVATGCIEYSVLRTIRPSANRLVLLTIVCITLVNPIGMSQISTGCNDSLIYYFICLIILFTINIWHNQNKNVNYFVLCLTIVLAINTKNNALFFELIAGAAIVIGWYVYYKTPELKRYFFICCAVAILGLCLWGYHPFMTNLINEGNPLYPHSKEAYNELIEFTNRQESLSDHNQFVNFYISLFSTTAPSTQPYLGGYGFLFAIIYILGLLVFVISLIKEKLFTIYHYSIVIIVLLPLAFVASWIARFNPLLWLLVPCSSLLLITLSLHKAVKYFLLYSIFLLAVMDNFMILKYNFVAKFYERINRDAIYEVYQNDTVKIKTPSSIILNEFNNKGIVCEIIDYNIDSTDCMSVGCGITVIETDSIHRREIMRFSDSIKYRCDNVDRIKYLVR